MNLKKLKMSYYINIIIIVLELIGFFLAISDLGFNIFEFYTQDSNLLVLLSSILYVIYFKKGNIPTFVKWLKFTSTVSISVTFLVVAFILSWLMGDVINLFFFRYMLFHHTLCPLLAVLTFVFFENYDIRSNRQVLRTIYFTLIYAFILIILNVLNLVNGPYPFLMVNDQSIYLSIFWFILIIGGTFLIALFLKVLNKRFGVNE